MAQWKVLKTKYAGQMWKVLFQLLKYPDSIPDPQIRVCVYEVVVVVGGGVP